MGSNRERYVRLTDAAPLLSGVLLYLGVGLRPVAFLTWFALLPVLWAAPRVSARRAALYAALAWVIGQVAMWVYFTGDLEMPPPIAASLVIYGAVLFVGVTLLARTFLLRGRMFAAVGAASSLWVVGEYLASLLLPHGAWWSLAYSQADVRPLLQLVSITGVWGITFLLVAFPTAVAAMFTPGVVVKTHWQLGAAGTAVLVLVASYGAMNLAASSDDGAKIRVGVAVAAQNKDDISADSAEGQRLTAEYVRLIDSLANDGARAVVLPEKAFLVDKNTLPKLADPISAVAAERHVDVVLGAMMRKSKDTYTNIALAFPGQGGKFATYTKQHLVPGAESDFAAGKGLEFVPGSNHRLGVIICKDLDFPNLVRDFRNHGSTVLLAPAWDFFGDGWLHSRMAVTRGVESGLSVARAGRDGRLTISDATGRVLAEKKSDRHHATTVVASVSTDTPRTSYARFGDWFAWLCVAGALTFGVMLIINRRRKREVEAPERLVVAEQPAQV